MYIYSFGDPRIVRFAANATNPSYNTNLVPGTGIIVNDGTIATYCGYSFSTPPTPSDPFSGVVNTAAYQTGIVISGKTYNPPSGRAPYVSFTYNAC